MGWLLLVALTLGILGAWLLLRSGRGRRQAGLPRGRVTYSDTGAWEACPRPLFSNRHRLTGRPDYLVHGREGIIPVEVKSGSAPATPYEGHVLQLAAYCLLVEEQEGCSPSHGILKYDDRTLEIDFTPELRERVLAALDAVRHGLSAPEVEPNHHDARRCRNCGYRPRCGRDLG